LSGNDLSVRVTADSSGYTAELDRATKSAAAFSAAQDAASQRVQVAQAAIAEAAANGSQANARAINNLVSQLARAADAAGKTQTQMLAQKAAMLGVADSVSGYISQIESAATHTDHLNFSTSAARRELLVLAHEASQGNWTRFGGSLLVLGERIDAMSLLLSPLGIGLGIAGAAAYAFFKTVNSGAAQFEAFNSAIRTTGGFIGMSAQEMADLSIQFQTAGVSLSTVREAMAQVAATGAFTASNLGLATQAALAMSADIGIGTDKAAESLAKIQDNVIGWVTQYQQAHHTFSAAQIEEIENFVKLGDTTGAYNSILRDLTAAHAQAAKDGTAATSSIAQGWKDIVEVVNMYKNMIANLGAPASLTKQIGDQMAAVDAAKKDLALQQSMGAMGKTSYAQAQLEIEQKKLDVLRDQQAIIFTQQKQKEKDAQSGDNALRLGAYMKSDKYAGPSEKHTLELQTENTAFATATQGIDKGSAEYQNALKKHYAAVQQINDEYAKKTKPHTNEGGLNAAITSLEGQNKLIEDEERRHLTSLKAQRDAGVLDQEQYLQAVYDAQASALDQEIANAAKREEVAKGKKEQSAYEAALTAYKKLVSQRQDLDRGLTDALATLSAQRSSDLAKYGQSESDSLQKQQADRQQQYATMFMSPEAKANANAAYALTKQYYDKQEALQKTYDSPGSDQTLYQAKLATLQTYYDAQLADLKGAQAKQLAVRNSYADQIKLALVQTAGQSQTNAELMGSAFKTAFGDMENALESFVTTGKFNFSSFAVSVLADMAKIALKAAESQIFNSVLSSSSFFSQGGSVGHFATGGAINGPGTGTSDSIPAMLSDGEYVINAASVKKYGSLLDSINSGSLSHFSTGGAVGSVATTSSASSGGSSSSISLSLGAGNQGLTMADLQAIAPHIQMLVDKRITQRTNGQGGIMYRVRNGQN
jgi:lambda family phage tail tape measure protein